MGVHDSVFIPITSKGERYMEYLHDHGQFEDLPEQLFFAHLRGCYPHLFEAGAWQVSGDMQREASVID